MIGLVLLGLMVIGGFWLLFSLIGLIFKLVFGIIGGVFGLIGGAIGLFVAGILGLVMLPVLGVLMLPMLLPLMFLGAVVWLLTRGSRRPVVIVQQMPRA